MTSFKQMMWEHWHHRFGLAGEGQADIIQKYLEAQRGRVVSVETSDLERSRAGARHLMNHPAVSAVAADPRMVAIAGRFLGETAIPYKATLFDKSPARNWLVAWHQDTALPLCERREVPEWGPWSTKAGVTYAVAPASALAQVVGLRLLFEMA